MNEQTLTSVKPALFVVTSNGVKGETGIPTGFWLAELTHPLAVLQDAGFAVELASIQGGQPPIDGLDLEDATNARYWNDATFRAALAETKSLADVDPSRYSAIFFAGGHGTMWDFPESPAVRKVTRQIYEAGGIVSAVCHGPAALVNVVLSNGEFLVSGKRLAAFTNAEEEEVQATDIVPFLLASTLTARGALHQPAPNWTANIVVDGRLVTGQNPQSAHGVGEALRDLLKTATSSAETPAASPADPPHSAPAPSDLRAVSLTPADIRTVSPALAGYTAGVIAGDVWKRPGLSPRDRSLATLSALIARNQTVGIPHYLNVALDSGLTPGEISEAITHLAFYAGWPNALSAVTIAKDVFARRGIGSDQLPMVSPKLVPIAEAVPDEDVRVSFFVQNDLASVSAALVKYTDELLYHEVWLRPDLAPRDRDLVTVSSLIAAGSTQFLPFYLNRAILHGVTRTQISELLGHLAFYGGWSNAISAALVVKDVVAGQSKANAE